MYSPFPAVRSWPQVNFGMSLYVLEQTSPVALNIDVSLCLEIAVAISNI